MPAASQSLLTGVPPSPFAMLTAEKPCVALEVWQQPPNYVATRGG